MWHLWYTQVEYFSISNQGIIYQARVWEGADAWNGRNPVEAAPLELKTGIVYVQGRHYWQWRYSWRGPALLAVSLLLMLYGRLRLPKKPAISES
jgi:hypothetical protein